MKTTILRLTILLFCIGGITAINAQGLYNLATLDEEDGNSPLKWSAGIDFGYDDLVDRFGDGVEWADNTIGGSIGIGWGDVEGNSETSFCLGVEYLYKITGNDQNPNGAGYLGGFGNYHKLKTDNFDESIFRLGAKYSYFDRITAFNEVQLIYGANVYYETGSLGFSGAKEDLSGYGAGIYTGANFRVCDKVSLGVEVPVVSYLSRTFDSGGNEFSQDQIWAGVNKDNSASATLRWIID
ncbi:hypothetical protein FBALC1_17057 [Flavobacteriales bacterium ALC-1]|nr:hypothetical protein FBALC1_17057 [Flavobacteriales bacterium ALC-1]